MGKYIICFLAFSIMLPIAKSFVMRAMGESSWDCTLKTNICDSISTTFITKKITDSENSYSSERFKSLIYLEAINKKG